MDAAHTIVATPTGTLLVWSHGADELLARTLSADDKASWTYRDVPGVAAVAETISVNRRPRTLRLRMATVERLQANTANAAARHSGYAYQEEPRWSHGRWGMNWDGLDLPGASDAANDKVRGGAAFVLCRLGRHPAGPCAAAPGRGPASDHADRPPRPGG